MMLFVKRLVRRRRHRPEVTSEAPSVEVCELCSAGTPHKGVHHRTTGVRLGHGVLATRVHGWIVETFDEMQSLRLANGQL